MKKSKLALLLATAVALGFMGCQPEVEHVHTFSDTWSFDESCHWHEATCGHEEKGNLESHHFSEWGTVTEPTEYEDGSKERTCSTCEYIDIEIIFALGHHHNIKSEWSSDETSHWHAYDCGKDGHFEDKSEHSCDWVTTDPNMHWKVCGVCGRRIELADHNFIQKGNCWQECECGKKKAVSLDTLGTYDSTKMTFGVYPQTIKARDVTVDKTVKNTEITGADYYLGSDGAWYAECIENAYSTGIEYKYSNGYQVVHKYANSVKYFKVEPIEWVYLGSTKCLHAKKILTANVQWHASSNNYMSNNYKNSNIRSWLNGTFYNSAFTESQKKKIKTTTVDNSADSTGYSTNIYACEDTNDKVYLLSYKEATTTGNGFTADADRIRFPTDYALANYCINNSNSSYGGWWWLRSPYIDNSFGARDILGDGRASGDSGVNREEGGVVPALSISE